MESLWRCNQLMFVPIAAHALHLSDRTVSSLSMYSHKNSVAIYIIPLVPREILDVIIFVYAECTGLWPSTFDHWRPVHNRALLVKDMIIDLLNTLFFFVLSNVGFIGFPVTCVLWVGKVPGQIWMGVEGCCCDVDAFSNWPYYEDFFDILWSIRWHWCFVYEMDWLLLSASNWSLDWLWVKSTDFDFFCDSHSYDGNVFLLRRIEHTVYD